MKGLFLSITLVVVFGFSSCKECGECWISVDGKEEPNTRSEEVCGDDYEALEATASDQEVLWKEVYDSLEQVKLVCEETK